MPTEERIHGIDAQFEIFFHVTASHPSLKRVWMWPRHFANWSARPGGAQYHSEPNRAVDVDARVLEVGRGARRGELRVADSDRLAPEGATQFDSAPPLLAVVVGGVSPSCREGAAAMSPPQRSQHVKVVMNANDWTRDSMTPAPVGSRCAVGCLRSSNHDE